MTTDEFSYIGAWAPVTITVNSSEVDDLLLYYKMCIEIGDTENYRLISCLTRNKSVVDTSVNWKDMGAVVLTVGVYRDAGYSSLVDCADNRIVVASKWYIVNVSYYLSFIFNLNFVFKVNQLFVPTISKLIECFKTTPPPPRHTHTHTHTHTCVQTYGRSSRLSLRPF